MDCIIDLSSDNHNIFYFILENVYVELVRCPEHPNREDIYVVKLVQNYLDFHHPSAAAPLIFRWCLNHIRRSQYFKVVNKLEIEVGRWVYQLQYFYLHLQQ